MKAVVLIKQVPEAPSIQGEPGAPGKVVADSRNVTNPYDLFAIEEGLRAKEKHGGDVLAVTLGPQGMIWLDAKGEPRHMPSFPVHTVDTLGAGDVFHGAFTLEIAGGAEIEAAMRFSAAAAALKCTRFGGAFAAPSRTEVDAFLARAAPKS